MQISSRFTAALHILICADVFREERVTSDFLAASVNTNPVVVRRLLAQLKAAGLIRVARGTGGLRLAKALDEITLLDVYRAVDPVEEDSLFRFHESPNPACPVGRNIHGLLDGRLRAAQEAMERELRAHDLAELRQELTEKLAAEQGERSGDGKSGA